MRQVQPGVQHSRRRLLRDRYGREHRKRHGGEVLQQGLEWRVDQQAAERVQTLPPWHGRVGYPSRAARGFHGVGTLAEWVLFFLNAGFSTQLHFQRRTEGQKGQ